MQLRVRSSLLPPSAAPLPHLQLHRLHLPAIHPHGLLVEHTRLVDDRVPVPRRALLDQRRRVEQFVLVVQNGSLQREKEVGVNAEGGLPKGQGC